MKINYGKLVIDNYSTEEIIHYCRENLKIVRQMAEEGIDSQNAYNIGVALAGMVNLEVVLASLDEKLNGKKERTVVQ